MTGPDGADRAAILHVTEAMGGGIVTVLRSFVTRQADLGAKVSVLHTRRSDTPPTRDVQERLAPAVVKEIPTRGRLMDLVQLTLALWRIYNRGEFDVVHLHSSLAGGAGRAAYVFSRRRCKVFYSPHGYSFLRTNTSRLSRRIALELERVLSRVGGGSVLTCRSELRLAQERLGAPKAFVVQTGLSEDSVGKLQSESQPRAAVTRPKVAMIGRASYQKAPWRFGAVARELGSVADFYWYGGDPSDPQLTQWLGDAPVEVIGWLPPSDLERELAKVDILLFPSLWEGMPYALMMCQCRGIPAVVSDTVGNRDAVVHGTTGFVAQTDDELVDYTRRLLRDPALRSAMGGAAIEWAREALTDCELGAQSLRIYGVFG